MTTSDKGRTAGNRSTPKHDHGNILAQDHGVILPDIAAQIRAELQQGALHAARAGALLAEAKAALPHGEWLPWLAEHCQMSERSAQGYMRLPCKLETLPSSNTQRVADLPIRTALKELPEPRPSPSNLAEYRRLRGEILASDDLEAIHPKMQALYRVALEILAETSDIKLVVEKTDDALTEHIHRLWGESWPDSIGPAPKFLPLPGRWMTFATDDAAFWIVPSLIHEGCFHVSKFYHDDDDEAIYDGTRRPIRAHGVELMLVHMGLPDPSAVAWSSRIKELLLRPFGEPEEGTP